AEITAFAASEAGNGRLKNERALLNRALEDVQGILNPMIGWALGSLDAPKEIYKIGLNSTRLLLALGDLIVGWLLCRQAEIAIARLDDDGVSAADRAFYAGKVASAQFFCANVLPRLAADRQMTESTTLDLMELPEEAF
ncbi:MAG: acyl-CoA dehydrogenase C-terminal domain-containing protein, partial [Actinomadura sp.]